MKRLIKTLGITLLIGASTMSAKGSADNWCWDSCRWDGCWEIGAEALYWKSCGCGWQYGTVGETGGSSPLHIDYLRLSPDYDWGFRIQGGYYSCDACSFVTLDWIYFRSTDTIKKTHPVGSILATHPTALVVGDILANHAIVQDKFQYNRVNLRGGYYLYRGCDVSFYALAGIRWVDIEDKRNAKLVQEVLNIEDDAIPQQEIVLTLNPGARYREKSDFWGVGIEVGFGADYDLGCGFQLVGRVAGTTAVGRRSHHIDIVQEADAFVSGPVFIRTTTRTQCVPGLDFRLGFAYTYDCDCVSVTGEIGYESNYYFNALASRQLKPAVPDHPEVLECVDAGFAGPYASIKLRF